MPDVPPLTAEAALIGSYGIPIPPDNGWAQGDVGWQPTPLVIPANQYVLIEVDGGVRYMYNGDCFIGATPCAKDLDGRTTGPLNDAGASYVYVGVERAGGGGVGAEMVMHPRNGTSQTAMTSYKLVYFTEPRRVYTRRRITYGGSWDPILATYAGYQYALRGNQQVRLTQIPEPISIVGPSQISPGQRGKFEATLASGLQLRIPDGVGAGNFDLITWEFFKSDTLAHETWREIWPLTACTGKLTCEFSPSEGIAGKLRVTAWVEGVPVLQKSQVVRVRDAELQLECSGDLGENRVTRGETLTCTASVENGTLTVESWSFSGTDSQGASYTFPTEFDGPITTNRWSGTMAISGTVTLIARINGGGPKDTTAAITVVGRSWEDEPVEYRANKVSWSEFPQDRLPPPYPTEDRHLGRIAFGAEFLPPAPDVVREILDKGPNHYLVYFTRIPVELVAKILVHPELEARGDFWRRQAAERPAFGNPCLRSQFDRYVQLVLSHEGYPPNPQSHSGVYIAEFQKRAGSRVEDLVYQNTELRAMGTAAVARLAPALAEAATLADEPVDARYKVQFGCTFNWDQRG